ncbi:MAG TPA: hypothetical protein VNB95_02110, partial [Nitrososphaera sp.]|nr:hypothetical protein [Nitrososphaera sp.]
PPITLTRCALMIAAPSLDWNVFKQIFAEHWDGFKHVYPRYDTSYYLIIPLCSMSPKFLNLLKMGHENAS